METSLKFECYILDHHYGGGGESTATWKRAVFDYDLAVLGVVHLQKYG